MPLPSPKPIELCAIRPVDPDRPDQPVRIVVAGYRARVCEKTCGVLGGDAAVYGVRWESGSWSDVGQSAGFAATAARAGMVTLKGGRASRILGGVQLGTGGVVAVGAAATAGVAQFRRRLKRAADDGRTLAESVQRNGWTGRTIHLVGHSLGTVFIRAALPVLHRAGIQVGDLVLMGGAAGRRGWNELASTFTGRLTNLYSPRDRVLSVSPIWERVIGTGPIADWPCGRVVNHDLSARLPLWRNPIAHHSGYWRHLAEFVS